MLHYKPVTVERLICTCDRCKKTIDPEIAEIDWQERFIISFRAGYGSVFGDGNLVEGDFCQDCINSVLGKWLRTTDTDHFDVKHSPANVAEKIMQPYQHKKLLEERGKLSDITAVFKTSIDNQKKRQDLAKQLGVLEEQVASIAYDYLLQASEHLEERSKDEPQPGKTG
jgi:hypothetical protein